MFIIISDGKVVLQNVFVKPVTFFKKNSIYLKQKCFHLNIINIFTVTFDKKFNVYLLDKIINLSLYTVYILNLQRILKKY